MMQAFLKRRVRTIRGVLSALALVVCAMAGNALAAEVAPQEGDGIYSLLRRHGFAPTHADVEAFIQLNQDRLGAGNSLFLRHRYRLPGDANSPEKQAEAQGSRSRYPLFGPKYEWVEKKETVLSGCVFYLVSGHGGPDPGAIGEREGHRLAEDEYAYDITLRLARVLLEHGAQIYLIIQDPNDGIRDGQWLAMDRDEVNYPKLKIPVSQVMRLRQRANAVNTLYGQRADPDAYHRLIVIHVDSRSLDHRVDVFFYHHEASRSGKRLANNLREVFEDNYEEHQPGRGYRGSVSSRRLHMLTQTTPPAVFIELGNIRNRNNQYRFIDPANRQALAEWICEGIVRDYRSGK
ncbi:MAG: N-acetylmuramoyl-L-alanine amidase [Verrucomicrobiales bacterium]|nr:N-acetylmuramoyl-L-alanine amidase [Verrucomicrobiales bacterium]MCP5525607.1 N-acetylmuramoyl-L-alanine amidase [Verrucomicrobiales bacterium]